MDSAQNKIKNTQQPRPEQHLAFPCVYIANFLLWYIFFLFFIPPFISLLFLSPPQSLILITLQKRVVVTRGIQISCRWSSGVLPWAPLFGKGHAEHGGGKVYCSVRTTLQCFTVVLRAALGAVERETNDHFLDHKHVLFKEVEGAARRIILQLEEWRFSYYTFLLYIKDPAKHA